MCKYLFSSGQSTEIEFLEPSFIQYIDSVAYIYIFNIFLYTFKNFKSWNKYIKTYNLTICTACFLPSGFSSYKTLPAYTDSSPPKIQGTKNILFSLACTDI